MKKLEKRIPGLGADHYTWEDIYWEGRLGVAFTKGRYFVLVSGYSSKNVTKLASYVIKEISTSP